MTGSAETLLKIFVPILVVCLLIVVWQVGGVVHDLRVVL